MYQRLAFVFLALYILALFRPVYPLVKDSLAHLLWEHDHLAHVHAHNGEFHVHEEVKKIEEKNTASTPTPASAVSKVDLSIHIAGNVVSDFIFSTSSNTYITDKKIPIKCIYLEVLVRPPNNSLS